MDYWLTIVCVAQYLWHQIRAKSAIGLLIFLMFVIIIRMYFYKNMYDVGIAIGFALSLFVLKNTPELLENICRNTYFQKLSRLLASYSYSLYLIHYSVIELFIQILGRPSILSFLAIFMISNMIAYCFYLVFEKNHYKLNKYLKLRFQNYILVNK